MTTSDETYVLKSDTPQEYQVCLNFLSDRYPQGNLLGYVVTGDEPNLTVTVSRTGISWVVPI